MVAVPDFAPGAMENWGLITFRTYALLIEEYGSQDRKHEIAATVIHEISHQVFFKAWIPLISTDFSLTMLTQRYFGMVYPT